MAKSLRFWTRLLRRLGFRVRPVAQNHKLRKHPVLRPEPLEVRVAASEAMCGAGVAALAAGQFASTLSASAVDTASMAYPPSNPLAGNVWSSPASEVSVNAAELAVASPQASVVTVASTASLDEGTSSEDAPLPNASVLENVGVSLEEPMSADLGPEMNANPNTASMPLVDSTSAFVASETTATGSTPQLAAAHENAAGPTSAGGGGESGFENPSQSEEETPATGSDAGLSEEWQGNSDVDLVSAEEGLSPDAGMFGIQSVPTVTVTPLDNTATEGTPATDTAKFNISRGSAAATSLVVYFHFAGTATYGATTGGDYTANCGSSSVTINANSAATLVTITPVDDTAWEDTESVQLVLDEDPNGNYTPSATSSSATVNIRDNDVNVWIENNGNVDWSASETDPGTATVTLRRDHTSGSLTVRLNFTGGTATYGSSADYTANYGSISVPFSDGASTTNVIITPRDDTTAESVESVVLNLSTSALYTLPAASTLSATVTIEDNDATVSVSATDNTATESNVPDTAVFRITRNWTTGTLTIPVTWDGTALGSDYTWLCGGNSSVVSIPNGALTTDVTIIPVDDSDRESSETVNLNLAANDSLYLRTGQTAASISIYDNDPTVWLEVPTDAAAGEHNADTATFTISRNNADTALTVHYTLGGTATYGSTTDYDYTADCGSTSVTMAAGVFTAAVTITPNDDSAVEGDESVTLTLATDSSYSLAAGSTSATAATAVITDDDGTVSVSSDSADGGDNWAGESQSNTGKFVISRNWTSGTLQVPITWGGSADSGGADYAKSCGTATYVTIPNGALTTEVTITPVDDATIEPTKTVILNLSANSSRYHLDPLKGTASANLYDNDTLVWVDFAQPQSDPYAKEANGQTAKFRINRNASMSQANESTGELIVNLSFASGTALYGLNADFTANCGNTAVTIPEGQLTADVTITPRDDLQPEGGETVLLQILSSSLYTRSTNSSAATAYIQDANGTVTITATDNDATEGYSPSNPATFRITRSWNTGAVVLPLAWAGTAVAGTDFAGYTAVAITTGAFTADITIYPTDDALIEGDETAILRPAEDPNAAGATVTIHDNDLLVSVQASDSWAQETTPPATSDTGQFTISRNGATAADLTVYYQFWGSAASGSDYTIDRGWGSATIPAGQNSIAVTVTPQNDETPEGDETVEMVLTPGSQGQYQLASNYTATVTIYDNDVTVSVTSDPQYGGDAIAYEATPVTDTGKFVLTRNVAASQALSVYFSLGGTASSSDYTTNTPTYVATIPAYATSTTITVTPSTDTSIEGEETVILTLSSLSYSYNLAGSPATITIYDDDLPTLSVTPNSFSLSENGSTGYVYLSRDGGSYPMTVNFDLSGMASNGTDYQYVATSATFLAGSCSVSIPITSIPDTTAEGNETLLLSLRTQPGIYLIGSSNSATITITDDDLLVNVRKLDDASEANLDPGHFALEIADGATLDHSLTVYYNLTGTASQSTDYTVSPGLSSATIPAYSNSISVSIGVMPDTSPEGNETVTLWLSSSSSFEYRPGTTPSASLTIADDDVNLVGTLSVIYGNEGSVSNSGTVGAGVTLSPSVGNISQSSNGTWSWSGNVDGPQSTTVTLTAWANGTNVGEFSFPVLPDNVAPTATLSNGGPVVENDPVTVSFSNPNDPSTADTNAGFKYSFALEEKDLAKSYLTAWNSPTSQDFTFACGTGHQAKIYDVLGRIFDKDGGSRTYVTQVKVLPQISARITSASGCTEGDVATLTGAVDYLCGDAFTVEVQWGNSTDTFTYPAGQSVFTVTHYFADDDPTNSPSDDIPITATVTAAYGRHSSASWECPLNHDTPSVTVNNGKPTVTIDGPAQWTADQPVTFTASVIDDPGDSDTFTYEWYKNGGKVDGVTGSTYTCTPTGQDQIAVKAIDDDTDDSNNVASATIQCGGSSGAITYTRPSSIDRPTITISNDDPNERVMEGEPAHFKVSLTPAVNHPVTVFYNLVDGSATAFEDYTPVNASGAPARGLQRVFFLPLQTEVRVEIPTLIDAKDASRESLSVTLTHPHGGTLGTSTATLTIEHVRGDLDTDSDNTSSVGAPDHSQKEEDLEEKPDAKYIVVQKLDGGNPATGTRFVPLDLTVEGDTTASTQVRFIRESGSVAIWSADVPDSPTSISFDTPIYLSNLSHGQSGVIHLFVEAFDTAPSTIRLDVNPKGSGPWIEADRVLFTPLASHVTSRGCACSQGPTIGPDGKPLFVEQDVPGGGLRVNGQPLGADARLIFAGNALVVEYLGEVLIWDRDGLQPREGVEKQGTLAANGSQYVWTRDGVQCTFSGSGSNLGALVDRRPAGAGNSQNTFDPQGRLSQTTTTVGEDGQNEANQVTDYTYDTVSGLPTQMQVSLQEGSQTQVVNTVNYVYCPQNDAYGNAGDLQLVTIRQGNGPVIDTKYYRYYRPGEANGIAHAVKFVFHNQALARMRAAGIDPLNAADATVKPYADEYFQYNAQGQVEARLTQGTGCSLCGGQGGTSYASGVNSQPDTNPNHWSNWHNETQGDASVVTTYFNYRGQELLRDVWNGKTNSGEQHWITYTQYDDGGNVILTAQPSAVNVVDYRYVNHVNQLKYNEWGYDSSAADLGVHLYADKGLIEINEYYPTTTTTEPYNENTPPTTGGGVAGYFYRSGVKEGSTSPTVWQNATDYIAKTTNGITVYYAYRSIQYPTDSTTVERTSTNHYHFFTASQLPAGSGPMISMLEMVSPGVSTDHNGPGVDHPTSTFDVYDTFGRTVWSKDAAGYISYTEYDPTTGAVVKRITDVDLSRNGQNVLIHASDFTSADIALLPSAWSTPTGGGQRLITVTEVDSQGRTTKTTDPAGNVTYTVYNDLAHETRTYSGWNATTHQTTGPITVSRDDLAGNYSESLSFAWNDTNGLPVDALGRPTGTESLTDARAVIQSLSRSLMNSSGQATESREYFSMPAAGYSTDRELGEDGENYLKTESFFDKRGRLYATHDPSGTVHHTFYDVLGRVTAQWVGTDDIPDALYYSRATGDPSPGPDPRDFRAWLKLHPDATTGPTGTSIYKVSENTYDYGDIGDGNLTAVTKLVDTDRGHDRLSSFQYDGRDQQILAIEPPDAQGCVTYARNTYDNLGQVVMTQRFWDYDNDIANFNNDKLLSQNTIDYDELGRICRTSTYSVDITQANPQAGAALTTDTWYDAAGRVIKSQEPGAQAFTKTIYDGVGRPLFQYVAYDATETGYPDPSHFLDNDTVLSQTEYQYDAAENVTFVTTRQRRQDATGTGALTDATSRTSYVGRWYDALGRLTATANYGTVPPTGGRPAQAPAWNNAAGALVTSTAYNDRGDAYLVTDPAGHVGRLLYDLAGRVTEQTENYVYGGTAPDQNATITNVYDSRGNLWKQSDPVGDVTEYLYDGWHRLQYQIDPDPDGVGGTLDSPVTEYAYNLQGETTTVTDPLEQVTTYDYDKLGRVVKMTQPDPDGDGVENPQLAPWNITVYDVRGSVESVTDRLGNATTYGYDGYARRISETDANNATTDYAFYDAGQMLSLTDPEQNTTAWEYDQLGRVITETNELGAARHFVYDGGNLVRRVDRLGRVEQFDYDRFDQTLHEYWYPTVTAAENDSNREHAERTISYSYNALGAILSVSDPAATYGYIYDGLGRVMSITETIAGLTPTIIFNPDYNAAGFRTELSATIGTTLDFQNIYTPDGLGRTKDITQQGQSGGNAVAYKRAEFHYDSAGRPQTVNRYASTGVQDFVAASDYIFDHIGRLTDLTHRQGETMFADYEWGYDAASRMTQMKSWRDRVTGEDWGVTAYTNDDSGQLTDAVYSNFDPATAPATEDYDYDSNGNRQNNGFDVGDNNQMTAGAGYRYLYDAEGNRSERFVWTDVDTDGQVDLDEKSQITTYTWDQHNRLVEVVQLWNTVAPRVVNSYDAFDHWVGKAVYSDDNPASTPIRQTRFLYDGDQVVEQFDKIGSGNLTAVNLSHRYLFGTSVDNLLADEQVTNLQAPGDVLWTLGDHLNTVRDIAEYDSQTETTRVTTHLVYNSFGELTSAVANPCLFGFTARPFDADTGLQYNWHRWYEAQTGKWLSEDPIGFDGGDTNLLRYVTNSPASATDPFGAAAEMLNAKYTNGPGVTWGGVFFGIQYELSRDLLGKYLHQVVSFTFTAKDADGKELKTYNAKGYMADLDRFAMEDEKVLLSDRVNVQAADTSLFDLNAENAARDKAVCSIESKFWGTWSFFEKPLKIAERSNPEKLVDYDPKTHGSGMVISTLFINDKEVGSKRTKILRIHQVTASMYSFSWQSSMALRREKGEDEWSGKATITFDVPGKPDLEKKLNRDREIEADDKKVYWK